MDYETFTRTAAQRAGLPEDTTERIEQATLRALAEQSDVGREEARRGASAVPTTVRDAVTPGEFEDVISQLPMEYRALAGATS